MAVRRRSGKKTGKGYRLALGILAGLALAVAAFFGAMALKANAVQVRRAEAFLADLPPAFDGATVLFASDIDLCGLNTARKAAALMDSLQALQPDILILGGDYTSESVFDALNRGENRDAAAAKRLRERTDFFHYISAFSAPLGKFAIAAPEDGERDALAAQMNAAGIRLLYDDAVSVQLGDGRFVLLGASTQYADFSAAAAGIRRDDCVLVAAYSPELFPRMLTAEAQDGGSWVDLALAGHTHGGQIVLFGRSILNLTSTERDYMEGWRIVNGIPILVSGGLGCEAVNVRVGSQPRAYLVRLKKAAA